MDFNKYITNRNVAILGTITFHVVLFAIFTHVQVRTNYPERTSELLINFIEPIEPVEEEIEEIPEQKPNILDEFTKPLTSHASSRSNENNVDKLRSSMKSLEDLREDSESENKNVDLFSEDAKHREVKTTYKKEERKEGRGEGERKTENAYTGKSTINYYLKNRYSDKLPNPIYTCINGGLIYIDIKVNQQGQVTDVNYNRSKSSTSNECLKETALKYAKRAKFNSDFSAKETQKGYITYQFSEN
ncbi:MAG: hypothetical protein ABFR62_04760 [Bacteroidota bacterium]